MGALEGEEPHSAPPKVREVFQMVKDFHKRWIAHGDGGGLGRWYGDKDPRAVIAAACIQAAKYN